MLIAPPILSHPVTSSDPFVRDVGRVQSENSGSVLWTAERQSRGILEFLLGYLHTPTLHHHEDIHRPLT